MVQLVIGLAIAFVILFVIGIAMMSFTVQQETVAVIQRLGKFSRMAGAGWHFKLPAIEQVAGRLSLRVQQLDVRVESKTADNVFVNVVVAVQYHVLREHIYEAFYKLADPHSQITSFVFDVVRAKVPQIKLDDVFEKKDEIADAVKDELAAVMKNFGYGIVKSLVTDIDPNAGVKQAMNEINAAERLRVAAYEKGEADKIIKVKAAEADAESKALQGKGIADQRREIINGLRESVDDFRKGIPGATAQDVMSLILMTQYFDTLKDVAQGSKTNSVLIPHSPSHLQDLAGQIRSAIISSEEVIKNSDNG